MHLMYNISLKNINKWKKYIYIVIAKSKNQKLIEYKPFN